MAGCGSTGATAFDRAIHRKVAEIEVVVVILEMEDFNAACDPNGGVLFFQSWN